MTKLITAVAARTGFSEKAAEVIVIVAGILLGLAATFGGTKLWLHFHDAAVVRADRAEANVRTLRQNGAAQEQSAIEQSRDDRAVAAQQMEMHDAIHAGPDAAPDAAHVRLNCLRLRRAGADTDRLSACGRSPGGDGTQAEPEP